MNGVRLLLDTNVVIGLLKGYGPAVELVNATGMPLAQAAVSQITRMELLGFPGITPIEERAIQAVLQATCAIAIDEEVEKHAITLRRKHNIKLPDAIIAGTAIAKGLQLVTLDKALLEVMRQAGNSMSLRAL